MSSSGWEIRFSNSRQLPYFHNSSTGASVWEKPQELSDDQVEALPGAQYLKGNGGGAAALNGSSGAGAATSTVRASHLLVKHAQSRRPSSWKEVSIDLLSRTTCQT